MELIMKKLIMLTTMLTMTWGSDVIIKSAGTDASNGVVITNSNDVILVDIDGDGLMTAKKNLAIENGSTGPGKITLFEDSDNGSNSVTLQAGSISADVTFTLPTADGSDGQFLKTNGSGTLSWTSASAAGIGEKYIEITLDGVYGDGAVNFDLDAALGSNNPWYVLEALTVTEWDGNTSYFNIQLNVSDEQENTGGLTIDYQSNRVRPRFYGSDNVIYTYSSNGQHLLRLECYGRSSTIKVLFRVTSDWSS
jgi:hypothetical protein